MWYSADRVSFRALYYRGNAVEGLETGWTEPHLGDHCEPKRTKSRHRAKVEGRGSSVAISSAASVPFGLPLQLRGGTCTFNSRRGGGEPDFAPGRGSEKQCSEVWRLADNAASGVHSIDLGSKRRPRETTMQAVLNAPGRALMIEIETVSTPGMTDEVMDGKKAIKRASEPTIEERMKALSSGDGRGDLESPMGTYIKDELLVALIWFGTTGECNSYRRAADVSSEEGEEAIGFNLELSVRLNHLGIAMSASRM